MQLPPPPPPLPLRRIAAPPFPVYPLPPALAPAQKDPDDPMRTTNATRTLGLTARA